MVSPARKVPAAAMATKENGAKTVLPRVVSPIRVDYSDLVSNGDDNGVDLSALIEAAFGRDGLGLIVIDHVPSVEARRKALLPLAKRFALLPADIKAKYEHPGSFYSFGWSHGKEKLQGGVPDVAKGSFYNNPTANAPFAHDPEKVELYPSFCHPNIWPKEEMPELEPAFMQLGSQIVDTGKLLARHVDKYVRSKLGSECDDEIRLFDVLQTSRVTKARLLHYFSTSNQRHATAQVCGNEMKPPAAKRQRTPSFSRQRSSSDVRDDTIENWCGWHNDHGSLTGLVPGMFIDQEGRNVREHIASMMSTGNITEEAQDFALCVADHLKRAGLYIASRKGEVIKVDLGDKPQNSMLFQIGETAQIHSGGILQATPHSVRGIKLDASNPLKKEIAQYLLGISRESFAVFMEPEFDAAMRAPTGVEKDNVQSAAAVAKLPSGCPPLLARIGTKECPFTTCDFGTFSTITYKKFLNAV